MEIGSAFIAILALIGMPFGFLCGWQVCKYHMLEKQEKMEAERLVREEKRKLEAPIKNTLSPEELVKRYDRLVSAT